MSLLNIATFETFLPSNIKLYTLSVKACFLKLKINTPLALNLSKFATSFLHLYAKHKNLFLLL